MPKMDGPFQTLARPSRPFSLAGPHSSRALVRQPVNRSESLKGNYGAYRRGGTPPNVFFQLPRPAGLAFNRPFHGDSLS